MRTLHPALVRHLAGALTAVAVLGGCGGGGGDGSAPERIAVATTTSNHFPLDANTRRIYSTTAGPQPLVTRAAGTQAVAAGTGTVLRSVDPAFDADDSTVYVATPTGIREFAAAGSSALERSFDNVETIRFPSHAGDTFVQVDRSSFDAGEDFDGDGRSDRVAVRVDLTVVGSETVAVPAGTFDNCLHQRQVARLTVQPSSGGAATTIDITADTWYAPNVGQVKTTIVSRSGTTTSSQTELLTAYRVGPRSSDGTALAVSTVAPSSGPSRGSATQVSAVFSKAPDTESFGTDSFSVRDSDNRRVAGTTSVAGTTATFVAAQAWASGSYTARIEPTVTDLIGNPLAAPRSWSFTVDATAPGIVSTTPAPDSPNVALDAAITLQFSEPPDATSVNSGTVRLSDFSNGSIAAVRRVEGSTVVIQPSEPLQRGRMYYLSVTGVTDALGNPMTVQYILQFRTTQGRFAYPVELQANGSGRAVAAGDINGDGIADLVMLGDVFTNNVFVRFGRADGSLADAVRIQTGTQFTCAPFALAIGDVNSDGRADLVLSGSCGMQVLLQTAAGALQPGQFFALGADALRIRDLDGDGRPDLVIATFGTIRLLRQGSDGLLEAPVTLAPSVGPFELGDVDGDGRIDIVAKSAVSGQQIVVLLQRAGGTFVTSAVLDIGSVWGASLPALGDFNGDGRLDIASGAGGNSPTSIAVFYQGVGGTFGPATKVTSYDIPDIVRSADVDGDGRADIVVGHGGWGAVGVYLQRADGTLAPESRYAAPYGSGTTAALLLADLTRDGRLDIVYDGTLIVQQPTAQGAQRTLPGRIGVAATARSSLRVAR